MPPNHHVIGEDAACGTAAQYREGLSQRDRTNGLVGGGSRQRYGTILNGEICGFDHKPVHYETGGESGVVVLHPQVGGGTQPRLAKSGCIKG